MTRNRSQWRAVRHREPDGGFTLVELLVAMIVFGVVASISVWGLRSFQRAQDESGTAHDVVAALRNVAERAQSEGRTYCVSFDTGTQWSVWRYSCESGWTNAGDTATRVLSGQHVQGDSAITVSVPFAASTHGDTCTAGAGRCAYFYPRGTASAGTLVVNRGSSGKTYTIKVEGLTGRVDMG